MRVILLIGQAASGKGTQAKLISDRLGLKTIAMGEILREHKRKGTDIGKLATELDKEGKLMPNETIIEIMRQYIMENKDSVNGFVLDGVVRTVEQAKALDLLIDELDISGGTESFFLEIYYLDVTVNTIIERALERGKTSGRIEDFDEKIIRKRINVFREKTSPVLDYYGDRLAKLNGELDVEHIYFAIHNGNIQIEPVEVVTPYTLDMGFKPRDYVKPPLGLKPQSINNSERLGEVRGAICRYYDAELEIPVKWVEEYNELIVLTKK